MHLHAFSYSFRVRRRSVAWRQFYRSSGPTTGLLQIKMIEKKFGDFPLSSLVARRSSIRVRGASLKSEVRLARRVIKPNYLDCSSTIHAARPLLVWH